MEKLLFGKKILAQLLVMIFIISGCLPSDIPSAQKANQAINDSNCTPGVNCAAGETDSTIGNGSSNVLPKIEIRHLIEPNLSTDPTYSTGIGTAGGGSYVRKLTIPKNFGGRLYVAGINIGSLSSRITKVRFKFGVNREVVTIPATVVQAPGITPQTNISVLVLDLRSQPFRTMRLPYDLFDYNEYTFNPDGSLASDPVQDNRNTGLYCRGLRVEDDPTFQGVGACDGLQTGSGQPSEECLYAYAKVADQGLVKESGSVKVPLTPSFPQFKSVSGSNYLMDWMSKKLMKVLPNKIAYNRSGSAPYYLQAPSQTFNFSAAAVPLNSTDSIDVNFATGDIWNARTILGSNYFYRGPYRLINMPDWQFKFDYRDIHGPKKLFREYSYIDYPNFMSDPLPDDYPKPVTPPAVQVLPLPKQSRIYFNSYLFPLAAKLDLGAGVPHMAAATPEGDRTERTLAVAGKTEWMDGANARAQSRNGDLEHIGSCNVSATIEIIAKDDANVDYVVSTANDVKLQLVRATQHSTDSGNEVLYSNYKSCTTNDTCGGSECCFNNRCWDQTLVSQCFDNSSTQGNKIIGESCVSDLECTSLCCNRTSGQCAPHNTITTPAVLCSKPIGDFCIAKEWCAKSTVVKCYVVKTGTDTSGNTTCRQQCYNTQEYGDCRAGVCIPPFQDTIPTFDPDAEGACDGAITAPSF